jgi:hypothetical protein
MPTIVLYTHSDVKDIWPVFFGQADKFLQGYEKIIFVDRDDDDIPAEYRRIIYDDKLSYRRRLVSCLDRVEDQTIIFQHEDMFLFKEPDHGRIELYTDYLLKTERSFIKLIRGGRGFGFVDKTHRELREIGDWFDYIFVVQPSIWKTDKFLELVTHSAGETIWELEVRSKLTCMERDILGFYVNDAGKKRGKWHWDSVVYPYIATGIVKGKWNSEYREEIDSLLKVYDIDINERGTT